MQNGDIIFVQAEEIYFNNKFVRYKLSGVSEVPSNDP